MPKSVCEEEMQSTHLDNNEVIIEYMTNAHSNKIKKLKAILIKSEPDREYTHHVVSDDGLPTVPENFTQKREVTIDSYSESISSSDKESSDDRTVTTDSDSSTAQTFKEVPCKWEADSKGIEAPYIK